MTSALSPRGKDASERLPVPAVVTAENGEDGRFSTSSGRILVVTLAALLLVACLIGSVMVGSSEIPADRVWTYLTAPDDSHDSYVIHDMRVTRTALGVLVGLSLAVAGAVMQAVTRNPLADPGLLGVNSGASLAIVVGAAFWGLTSVAQQFVLAAVGALVTAALVYFVGSVGGGGASPVRLVLAGVAFSAASGGIIGAILLLRPKVFDAFRFWDVGALTRMDVPLTYIAVPVLVGLVMVLLILRGLSDIALGDDLAAALGTDVRRTRGIALVALTLLCAAATAAAGPISFVGLMVPLFSAWLMGPHRGWIIALCAVLGPALVLSADIIGRLLARPSEMAVGLLTSFVGAPALLWMVSRLKGDRR